MQDDKGDESGSEMERFEDLATKLFSIPKKDIGEPTEDESEPTEDL